MTTITGIPAHALLVHALVVLTPLTAGLEILCALWPAARRRFVWLVLALATVVLIASPLATSAGEWLYDREQEHSAILQAHAERGEWMTYFAVAMLVVAVFLAVQHWLETRTPRASTALTVGVAVLAVVVGVGSIVGVVRIGHSGTQAKWGVISE
jgi:uncharacterized membrane protein